jgi:N-methylhydantoinase A
VSFVVGIDIGGTFTDGVAVDLETGKTVNGKAPTTHPDPFPGVVETLEQLAEGHERESEHLLARAVKFVHATTLTTNVLLERRGARVGLVATQGHGDAIVMMSGKGRVAGLSLMERRHFRTTDKPEPIVPRERIVEVAERVDSDGDVVVPLRSDVLDDLLKSVERLGVDACAVALLWSIRRPDHERRIAEALSARFPGLYVSISSALAPLVGEYERTATTVVNAYVAPAVTEYLRSVERELQERGLSRPLLVVQSSGGVSEVRQTEPVNTIESGPAAGVRGSVHLLDQLGVDHAIVTDVGGTTFKVAIVRNREPGLTSETVLGQYSLLVPMLDVESIGAGGGSIAWIDGQRLRVGPRSAGSAPGPACYGWGGDEPTVTDADLLLGFLNPDYFLGGRMQLSVDAAEQAVKEKVANELFGGDVIAAAAGIKEIIDAQMADLIRKTSVERGHDPREFTVIAYGGSGPVHCGAYAAELGAARIVVPPNATVYSAFGAAISDLHHALQVARQGPAPGDAEAIRTDLGDLEQRARETLESEGVGDDEMRISLWVDMRYRRQFYELRIPIGGRAAGVDEAALTSLLRKFEDEYARRYGAGARHGEDRIEYVRFGVDAVGRTPRPALVAAPLNGSGRAEPKEVRNVYWSEVRAFAATPVFDGPGLRPGTALEGPAVIEHPGTSIAIHPGQRARIDPYFNTVIELEGRSDADGRRSRHL